jgi:hypothetical protein
MLRRLAFGQPRRCLSSAHEAAAAAGLGVAPNINEIGVRKLYRDCLKLTYHIAANSAKGDGMRQMVRSSFRAQMHVTDEGRPRSSSAEAAGGHMMSLQNTLVRHHGVDEQVAVARKRDGLD